MLKYKRILLKLSGEALMGQQGHGIDTARLEEYCKQVSEAAKEGVQIAIVIGGGNIFRGMRGVDKGFDRYKGDYMGMLATTINGLAIESMLESLKTKVKLFTAFSMHPVGEAYSKSKAIEAMNNGNVIIITAGTGNPYFTTDSASALRAVELEADALLKGTRVDGVYTADPEKDPKATKYDELTFAEAYSKGLNIMDLTAFTLCSENNMPIIVFDMNKLGNLKKLISGEKNWYINKKIIT